MKKFGKFVATNRFLILVISILLVFPAIYGMANTKINYDILSYLPSRLDSVKGQHIISDEFNDAATSMAIIENMEKKDIVKIKDNISKVQGVEKVIWVDDLLDISVPQDVLPDKLKDSFYSGNSTMLIIKFKNEAASEETQNAISDIRKVMNKQCFLSGVSAIVKDTKDLSERETPFYVLIAVIFSIVVLSLTLKSAIIPFIFLVSMGISILYNFGTNIFFGEISYITKALAAVLQLGVTMDYSIFLFHRYDEERGDGSDLNESMAEAISKTMVSICGSSLTTIAGFLALCVMELTLGKDIGIVMAKGVLLGLISTVTILPSFILIFDKAIHKFNHKTILPDFTKTSKIVTNKYVTFLIIFGVAFIPAIYGQKNTKLYYNLDESLPKSMESIVATNKLKEQYNMITTHFIVVKDTVEPYKMKEMTDKISKVQGIEKVLSYDKFVGPGVPKEVIPKEILDVFNAGGYNLIMANSKYKAAREEENIQVEELRKIVKSYDSTAMVAGEGSLTKDLIEVADSDFKKVNYASIIAIFMIIAILFQSISLPIILVLSIELAIFINMAVPFYMGTTIPFIASIVIGCIQLGATVDYAILMTTRFREELREGYEKREAMERTVKGSAKSIVTSALAFFGATVGVAIVSKIDMIQSLCIMLARGSLVSMGVILFILPSILLVCEKFIDMTTRNWKTKSKFIQKNQEAM